MDMDIHSNSNVSEGSHLIEWNMCDWLRNTYRFHTVCKAKNTILGPTPGSEDNSSTIFGTSELKWSCSCWAACFKYLGSKLLVSCGENIIWNYIPSLVLPKANFAYGIWNLVVIHSYQGLNTETATNRIAQLWYCLWDKCLCFNLIHSLMNFFVLHNKALPSQSHTVPHQSFHARSTRVWLKNGTHILEG